MRDCYPEMKKPKGFDPSKRQVDEIKLFGALASESEDLVGYMRTGGCTGGCGACCTAFVVPLDPESRAADDFQDVVHSRLNVPIDPIVIGKEGTDDWERWLRLHDTAIFQLPSGVQVADLPVEIKKTPDAMRNNDEWFAWLESLGVAVVQRDIRQVVVYITHACDALAEDGACRVFGTLKRPKMCAEYPRHPTDIQGLESFCTYKFNPVGRTEIMARNIIGQGRPQPRPKKKSRKKKRGRR